MLSENKQQEAVEWMVEKLAKFPLGSQVSTSALYFGGEYTPGTPDPDERPFPISTLGAIDMRDVEGAEDDDLVKIESALMTAAKKQGLYLDKSRYNGIVTGAIYNLAFTSYGLDASAIDYANIARFVFEVGSQGENWQKIEIDFNGKECNVTCFGFTPQYNGARPEGLPFAVDAARKQSLLQSIKDAKVLDWTQTESPVKFDGVVEMDPSGFTWSMLVADQQHCHYVCGDTLDAPDGIAPIFSKLNAFGMMWPNE